MLLITLLRMQRRTYDTVTDVPILVPCDASEQQGLATFAGESGEKYQPVRAFTDADLDRDSRKNPLRTMLQFERAFFVGVRALLDGLENNDRLAIARARERLIEAMAHKRGGGSDSDLVRLVASSIPGLKPGRSEKIALELSTLGPRSSADEKWLLSTHVSAELESVRLVLWWSGTQFRPALYCPDLKSALYTFVLLKTVAGRGWGICPFCGLLFVQTRSDQNYCSIAHREAHRVARWRATKKGPKTRKKGKKKNVTLKTR
jgi:hypothetical protein